LQQAEIPGFLSSRQYIDFTDENHFERNVDKLVFPGITGKEIQVESFSYDHNFGSDWGYLQEAFHNVLGYSYISGLSPSRMHEWTSFKKWQDDLYKTYSFASNRYCSVIIVDMTFHGVANASEFILACRKSKESVYKNIVFVFHHPSNFFKSPELDISEELRSRFSHYYVIEKTHDLSELQQNVRITWNTVMQDLMRNERGKRR